MTRGAASRTLVRLPNWVGDALLALPALEGLCATHGGRLVWTGRAGSLALSRHLDPAGQRIALCGLTRVASWMEEAARMRSVGCGRALILAPSFSSAAQAWAAGIPERIGWSEQGRRLWLTEPVARAPRGSLHLCEEFRALARRAGAGEGPRLPRLPLDEQAAGEARALLADWDEREGAGAGRETEAPRSRLVALAPGARYGAAKQWPLESFAALGRRLATELGARILITGGPEERLAAERLQGELPPGACRSAAGRAGLAVSAELLRRCDVAVSNDSGAMHLAAACGTPVVALFGPTDPRWTGPLGERHQIVRAECSCAPCFGRTCRLGRTPAPCMAAIAPGEVFERVRGLLDPSAEPAPPALFLDRDGTLIEHEPYLHDPARVRLVSGAGEALRRARAGGYRIVVVSNQSGVARGYFGLREVEAVHAAMRAALASEGATIDRIYTCPHHPEHGGTCQCRKPAPGMLLQAARELPVDLARSVIVGDTPEDLEAGAAAGCRGILVRTGHGAEGRAGASPALPAGASRARDLPEAIEILFARNP